MATLLHKVKVKNMFSPRSHREVANQFIIIVEAVGSYFQSYKSIIAFIPDRSQGPEAKTILDENYWNYSTTTGKYRNEFLGEGIEETQRKIKDGTYLLADLNS